LKIGKDAPVALKDSKNLVRNLRLTLAYDGSEFAGWQVQPGLGTVQGTLASAIGRLSGQNVLPQGSGRTDAGVHALAQVATFATQSPIPVENWLKALNELLPPSIRVLDIKEVAPEFHARKSACAKTYRYRIFRGPICPPFLARYVWHYPYPLDELAMVQAAEAIIGEHDFTSFAAVDPEQRDREETGKSHNHGGHRGTPEVAGTPNMRTIFSSTWTREADEFIYTVRGSGFLRHMVRNLVGTFILAGKGTLKSEDIRSILEARNRSAAGPTAPASGLYLVSVAYDAT
jgi:tRNA pseudouridine38-40 synthase